MLMESGIVAGVVRLTREPRVVLRLAKGNVELWANLVVITWAVAFAIWQGVGFAITLGTVFAIWAILAVSLNLVVGFTGLLSVGHIGFFGIGAYAVAILTSGTAYEQLRTEAIPTFGWPFFAALPIGVALAGLTALAVGVVFNRFRDDIFVLVSFGFAIIAYNIFLNWRPITRGAFGIHDVATPRDWWVGVRRRAGVPRPRPSGPSPRRPGRLVHSDLLLRARAHRHSGGRTGN